MLIVIDNPFIEFFQDIVNFLASLFGGLNAL